MTIIRKIPWPQRQRAIHVTHDTAGQSKGLQFDNMVGLDSGPVTLAVWVKRVEELSGSQHIVFTDQTSSDADDGGVSFIQENSANNGDFSFRIRGSGFAALATDVAPPLENVGVWSHYVGTFAGVFATDNLLLYRDGVLVTTGNAGGGTRHTAPGSHSIGGRESTVARGFGGVIAGVGRWNRVLSLAEIRALSEGLTPLGLPAGLVICPDLSSGFNIAPGRTSAGSPNLRDYASLGLLGPPELRSISRSIIVPVELAAVSGGLLAWDAIGRGIFRGNFRGV